MTLIAKSCLKVFLMAFAAELHFSFALQSPQSPQPQPLQQSDAVSLQQLLDRDAYIAYLQALPHVSADKLTEQQRAYFLGMLAFHVGKLDEAAQLLTKGVNTNDKSLTSSQVESALETLGQADFKLCHFGASAQMYDDIDKAFGSQLGDGARMIREKRHLAALLQHVPQQNIQFSGDFTVQRTGLEYPVSIPQNGQPPKLFFAQFDTGAEISVLSASMATAWGVTLLEGTATLHGYSGGAFPAQPGYIPVLTIGTAELHNVAVYVTADENLYLPQIKRQTNALLGYSVVASLGRLTFAQDGSLTVAAQSPARDLRTSAAIWLGGHSLLVELGTQPVVSADKLTGAAETRLFMLDTGSASTWLTDHYLAEHTNVFHGPPPEIARLAGAGGMLAIPAYGARSVPLFAGDTLILLNGPHVLAQPTIGEAEHFFGVLGQDVLGLFPRYTIDLRNMTLTVSR